MSDAAGECPGCPGALLEGHRFCPACGKELRHTMAPTAEPAPAAAPVAPAAAAPAPPAPPAPAPAPIPVPIPAVPSGGHPHSPLLALLFGLLIPGAGQAYNGRPVKGFFVLFFTPLVVPWLLSLWGAWTTAKTMRAQGGRFGPGGLVWVFLQLWLFCNVALAVLLGLTIAGVAT